jgi:predicted nuclease of predicted toxin-antitoxin system
VFVADEHIDSVIVRRLRDDGHDVVWIAELSPGVDDERVLAIAEQQQRILLTADTDFGDFVFRQRRATAGIVLLRLAGFTPERKAAAMAEVIASHLDELRGAFTVVAPGAVRIRRP